MKKLTFLFILLASTFSSFAQAPYSDGHVYYGEVQNKQYFGRQVQVRTDATNLDSLTSVYDGSFAYDTLKRHFVGYDGSGFTDISFGRVRDTTITILSAAVLTLNSSPVTVVPAFGSGTVVALESLVIKFENVTTPYATNTTFRLTQGGTAHLASAQVLDATANRILQITRAGNGLAGATMLFENTATTATVQTGNPTSGDGDLKLYVRYRIIEF